MTAARRRGSRARLGGLVALLATLLGKEPYLSEFSATGQTLFDAHFPAPGESCRAYRRPRLAP